MTIITQAPHPILRTLDSVPFVDDQGRMTQSARALLQQLVNNLSGAVIVTPCTCVSTLNALVLTPLSVSPVPYSAPGETVVYSDYNEYSFVADATLTGNATMSVSDLPVLTLYKNHGAAQATTNDITINYFYKVAYVANMNSGAGGFVIL